MRKIINTHWGEDANPWCLLQGDGNGNLRSDAWKYWSHYDGVEKRVAFKDGKLLAFCANEDNNDWWWDRQDEPHEGIPFESKMPNDELGRTASYEMSSDGTLDNPTNIHRGNKHNGVYEEWYNNGQLKVRQNYKEGKENGLYQSWYSNGQSSMRCTYKDGKLEGDYKRWWNNGELGSRIEYENNKVNGVYEEWYGKDRPMSHRTYVNDKQEGVFEFWHQNGKIYIRENYKNGEREGLSEKWDLEGKLIERAIYVNGELVENLTDDVKFRNYLAKEGISTETIRSEKTKKITLKPKKKGGVKL